METYDKLWSEYNRQLKTIKTARYSLLLEIKDFYESIGKEVPDEVRKELNTSEFKGRRLSDK
jgi:hypothetical protein